MRTGREVLEGYHGKPSSKIEGKIKEFEIAEVDPEIDARAYSLYGRRRYGWWKDENSIFRCE